MIDEVLGAGMVRSSNVHSSYNCCIADLSCQCYANREDVCKHIAALAKTEQLDLSIETMRKAAEEIKSRKLLTCIGSRDEGSEVFSCPPL